MNVRFLMRAAAIAAAVALEIGLASSSAEAAQTKVFIDLNGSAAPASGEAGMTKAGWMEVTALAWGTGRGTTAGSAKLGAAAGKVSGDALNITVPLSVDAEKFFELSMTGKRIPVVELVDYRVAPKGLVPLYNIQLKNVAVSSVDWTHTAADKPSANISLVYESIETTSNLRGTKDDDPTTPVSWNRINNTKPDLMITPP